MQRSSRDGSLSWPEGGVILNRQHERSSPIMRVIPEDGGGRSSASTRRFLTQSAGRDLSIRSAKSGLFHGLSVEFEALDEGFAGELREIRKARLLAAAVVDEPSPIRAARVEVRSTAGDARGADSRADLWL